jgi:hypothetical protein
MRLGLSCGFAQIFYGLLFEFHYVNFGRNRSGVDMGKLRLTAHFEEAVRNIRAVMPDMSKKALKKSGFDFKSVPELKTEYWNAHRHNSNCYDFALNRPGRFRNPADLARESKKEMSPYDELTGGSDFFDFADRIRDGMKNAGLIELGEMPELSERGTLVALFMGDSGDLEEAGRPANGEPDIHFYALRRDGDRLVWAHKEGVKEVENLGPDPAAPFKDAPKHGDRLFGGFWLVPHRR